MSVAMREVCGRLRDVEFNFFNVPFRNRIFCFNAVVFLNYQRRSSLNRSSCASLKATIGRLSDATSTSIGPLFIDPIPLTPLQHDASMTKQTPILADELHFEHLLRDKASKVEHNQKVTCIYRRCQRSQTELVIESAFYRCICYALIL